MAAMRIMTPVMVGVLLAPLSAARQALVPRHSRMGLPLQYLPNPVDPPVQSSPWEIAQGMRSAVFNDIFEQPRELQRPLKDPTWETHMRGGLVDPPDALQKELGQQVLAIKKLCERFTRVELPLHQEEQARQLQGQRGDAGAVGTTRPLLDNMHTMSLDNELLTEAMGILQHTSGEEEL